jgi:hypothetical protein
MRLREVKVGDILIAETIHPCIEANTKVKVAEDKRGLYVLCKFGEHYLGGQVKSDDGDTLVGFRRAE